MSKLYLLLMIGTGGFLGSVARYLSSNYINLLFSSHFPYGTLTVNIIGCLIIGIAVGLFERFDVLFIEWRLFVAVGFCGGFTTFSAFALENISLLQAGKYASFAIYSTLSFTTCLISVLIGLFMSKINL